MVDLVDHATEGNDSMSTTSNWLTNTGLGLEDKATSLLDRIPGYRGYREKEGRRDADRVIRDAVAGSLDRQAARVMVVSRGLADQRRIADVAQVVSLADAISHVADRVRTASYGYAPLFSDREVGEMALDQLRRFDEGLVSGVDDLSSPITAVEAASTGGGDLTPAIGEGNVAVQSLNDRLDLRNEVLTTGEAASEESVVAVLSTAPPPGPHPAFSLNRGDAVSVLGDDFVVDARIDIDAGEQSVRFYRLNVGPPGQWLVVPRAATGVFATVTEATESRPPAAPSTEISANGSGEISGTEDASGRKTVRFVVTTDGKEMGARTVELDWSGERQFFVGTGVHPDDIEVFSATSGG